MIFVDTGAWYASYIRRDRNHVAARRWVDENDQLLLTTDYIVDEALTLPRSRGFSRQALDLGENFFGGLIQIHYLTPVEIELAWQTFRRYSDKEWSFTDCTSKVVIERLGLRQAFAFDQHFRQFGGLDVVPH